MSLTDELISTVSEVAATSFDSRDGQVVPETGDIALADGAVRLKATILYADLADSTSLVQWQRPAAAKIFKAFLAVSSTLIRKCGGHIRSFDGDRVMGVFIGDLKNTNAAKCALNINYAFSEILRPKFEARYSALSDGTHKLAHCVGVATGDIFVARSGIRNSNDLIWVGEAANIAAKLSALRSDTHRSFITSAVYTAMTDTSKLSNGSNMWTKHTWKGTEIYGSSWTWEPRG